MTNKHFRAMAKPLFACVLSLAIAGCGQAATSSASARSGSSSAASAQETSASDSASSSVQETKATAAELADGTYSIEVETDSSMFRADKCTLTVANGTYSAELVLPGEGYSRLYFGKAADAATADAGTIYDYRLNDENKYTFDIPVEALDKELEIATYGQRRDTWYDHKITFVSPDAK